MSAILVIENNPINMQLMADLLELMGYGIHQAETAPVGIALARAETPKLILMDIGLPGMDGLEATRILKQDPATKDIPIIAVTAHAMKGDRERALASGCDEYITKPIDIRELRKVVGRFIRSDADTTGGLK